MKKIIALLPIVALSSVVQASTSYGTLGNFDVVNDTGQTCHGFEIEIDDVHSTNIGGTYSFNHYGVPKIREDNADPLHPKVFVHYEGPPGSTSAFTNAAAPGTISPTNGHQCTNPSVNLGCEHFGVGIYSANYSAVKYNWLCKDASGTLALGPAVNVSTPVWTYSPPVVVQPDPNKPPVVQFPAQVVAVIPAPIVPQRVLKQFGAPGWVKVIKTSTHKAHPLALEELVSDDKNFDGHLDWTNGEPSEVESEWYLLQTNNSPGNRKSKQSGKGDNAGDRGEKTITRRYEFYAYTGGDFSIDGENGEAACDAVAPDNRHGVGTVTVTDAQGNDQVFDCGAALVVGDYTGAQMGEFNQVSPLALIENLQGGYVAEAFPNRSLANGGNTPYQTTVSGGAIPAGLTLDSATAVLHGAPTKVGVFKFTASVKDADASVVSKAYTLKVTGPGDVDGDGDIDVADLNLIKAKYGRIVAVKDPADLNGDLKVNVLDYRKAASLCSNPQCALVTPAS